MSHEELRVLAMRYAKKLEYVGNGRREGFGCGVIASEMVTSARDIPDVIGWRMGWSYLIECKASRADFFADAKKPQRSSGTGMGNYRYYFALKGMLKPEEIPQGWGLIEVSGKESRRVVDCEERQLDASAHNEEKRILLSLVRRIKAREFLILQTEPEGDSKDE